MLSSSTCLLRSLAAVDLLVNSPSLIQRTLEGAKVFEQVRIAQAEEDRAEIAKDREERDDRSSTGRLPGTSVDVPVLRYRDDKAAEMRARERHYKSPAYRELHRRYIGATGLGGFGGEKGFEYAPRMYVDPDRPHLKSVYNCLPVSSNVRYARFGHFVRELHMIDIDKMYRHARLVPTPPVLLTTMISNRVPLPDRSCGALVRQQGRRIAAMATAQSRSNLLTETKELFERLLLQNLPPAEVGVITHGELIKCCALAKDWSLGWALVHERAVSMMAKDPEAFMLTSDYFEALLELCSACYKVEEGLGVFEQILAINLRPTQRSLDLVLELMSHAVTTLLDDLFDSSSLSDGIFCSAARTSVNGLALDLGDDVGASGRRFVSEAAAAVLGGSQESLAGDAAVVLGREAMEGVLAKADEVWALYEYFDYVPTAESLKQYVKVLAALGQGDRVLACLDYAHAKELQLDEEIFVFAIHGLRHMKGSGRLITDLIRTRMERIGLTASAPHHQAALQGMALQADGASALHYAETFLLPHMGRTIRDSGVTVDITGEICLYALLAMSLGRRSVSVVESPAVTVTAALKRAVGATAEQNFVPTAHEANANAPARMLEVAKVIMAHLSSHHSNFDLSNACYESYFQLCAWVGEAIVDGHSMLKKVIADGSDITTRILNHLLQANASSPRTGSRHVTEELAQFLLVLPRVGPPTAETFAALERCAEVHGLTESTDKMWDDLLARAMAVGQVVLDEAERVPMPQRTPDTDTHTEEAPQRGASAALIDANELSDEDTARLLEGIPTDRPLVPPFVPVHAMRKHAVRVNIKADDVHLRKLGQICRPPSDPPFSAKSLNRAKESFDHKDSAAYYKM